MFSVIESIINDVPDKDMNVSLQTNTVVSSIISCLIIYILIALKQFFDLNLPMTLMTTLIIEIIVFRLAFYLVKKFKKLSVEPPVDHNENQPR